MTIGKAAALTAAFVGVFALGVAVGPSIRHGLPNRSRDAAVSAVTVDTTTSPRPAAAPAATQRARTTTAAAKTAAPRAVKSNTAARAVVPASEPRLHAKLKPVLNRGARMEVAAEGFRSAEEFATVAHAARNTNVPFTVLKHRVLMEGQTLAEAIHEAKPEVDARAEVARATEAARADIAAVGD